VTTFIPKFTIKKHTAENADLRTKLTSSYILNSLVSSKDLGTKTEFTVYIEDPKCDTPKGTAAGKSSYDLTKTIATP